MIRIFTFLGFAFILISCNNKRQDQGQKQIDEQVTEKVLLDVSQKKDIEQKESHFLVPDSIATHYQTDIYSTNKKKYYFTQREINGDLKKIVHDYLDIDRFMINGAFIQYIPYDSLISQFGSPDSQKRIEEIEYLYSIYRYDGINMTMHDYDSLVYCDLIEFKNTNNFILYDSLQFDSKTTITDFVNLYPLSCLNAEKDRLYNNEIKCDWIRFEPKGDYQRDDQHIFLFEKGYLTFYLYFNGDD